MNTVVRAGISAIDGLSAVGSKRHNADHLVGVVVIVVVT
jgi:hypothetical protein